MKNACKETKEVVADNCKTEQIAPYYKRDIHLIRETNELGTVNYYRSNDRGKLVFVHRSSLESEMNTLVDGLKVIEAAAKSNEQFELWSALTAIRQKFEERIDEIFRFVEQEVGEINIYCVGENEFQDNLRYGQVVGAKLALSVLNIQKPISETV